MGTDQLISMLIQRSIGRPIYGLNWPRDRSIDKKLDRSTDTLTGKLAGKLIDT